MMRMFRKLRMMAGPLALIGAVLVIGAVQADPRDFSAGITDASSLPTARDGQSAEWQMKQEAAAAAAEQALKSAPVDANVAPGQLAPGDKIRLTIFGEPDLSGEFDLDNTGSLSLPLVGEVPARGLTPRELEKKLTKTLENGYLVAPRVTVEVLSFRPFFILGEVNKPGSYPFVNELTVINAVATAGGYTPRAKTGQVKLQRATDPSRKEEWVSEDTKVYPGDVIRVDERFF